MRLFYATTFFKKGVQSEKTSVRCVFNFLFGVFDRMGIIGQSCAASIQHAHSLLQSFRKGSADCHDFTDALHFCSDSPVGGTELVDVPSRHFNNEII